MVYAEDPAPGRWVEVKEVPAAERRAFLHQRRRTCTSSRARRSSSRSHYGCPMDIEWGKDGETGAIYILQARPETVQSRAGRSIAALLAEAALACAHQRPRDRPAHRRGPCPRRLAMRARCRASQPGDVIVSDMTDPDWEPVMKRAAAIVTNRGGRTCHAAIIARELGIPAVVGCGDATTKIRDGEPVTVSCAEGDTGVVYEGQLDFEQQRIELDALPKIARHAS